MTSPVTLYVCACTRTHYCMSVNTQPYRMELCWICLKFSSLILTYWQQVIQVHAHFHLSCSSCLLCLIGSTCFSCSNRRSQPFLQRTFLNAVAHTSQINTRFLSSLTYLIFSSNLWGKRSSLLQTFLNIYVFRLCTLNWIPMLIFTIFFFKTVCSELAGSPSPSE